MFQIPTHLKHVLTVMKVENNKINQSIYCPCSI